MLTSDVCFPCLAWLYELFAGTLILLTNTYPGCGRPTLNFVECFDLGRSVPTSKPLHLVSGRCNVCIRIVSTSLAWIRTWRRFAIFVVSYIVLSFFVFFNATQVKHQKIWLCFETISFAVIIIRCLGAMKIKDCRTNDIRFISKLGFLWGSSVTFDPEINLFDDAVGRSRYEQFYSVRSN